MYFISNIQNFQRPTSWGSHIIIKLRFTSILRNLSTFLMQASEEINLHKTTKHIREDYSLYLIHFHKKGD
jgi:hypothetical protein